MALITGIICKKYCDLELPEFYWHAVLLATPVAANLFFFVFRKSAQLLCIRVVYATTLFWLFMLGAFSYGKYQNRTVVKNFKQESVDSVWVSKILKVQKTLKGKTKAVVELRSEPYKGFKVAVTIDTGCSDRLFRNDFLLFKGCLNPIPNPKTPFDFNYKQYMANMGVHYQAFLKVVQVRHVENKELDWLRWVDHFRDESIKILNQFIGSGQSSAISIALVVGEKSFLDQDTKESYSKTGLMHLLAVSGMHVGLVYLFLTSFLSLIFHPHKHKVTQLLIVVTFLVFYSLFTGCSPSVVRACFMCGLFSLSKYLDRNVSLIQVLTSTAFVMLLVKPEWLFDVGFQLSFVAVWGIAVFLKPISSLYTPKNKVSSFFWSGLCVTLSAQLAVTPLTMYYFQSFPTYFLVSNLAVLPLAVSVVYCSFLTLLLFWVPYVNVFIGKIAAFLLQLNHWLVTFIASFPNAQIAPISLSLVELFVCYGLLFAFSEILIKKNHNYVALVMISVVFLFINKFFVLNPERGIYVFHMDGVPYVAELNGRNAMLHIPKDEKRREEVHHWICSKGVTRILTQYHTIDKNYFGIKLVRPSDSNFGNAKFLGLSKTEKEKKISSKKVYLESKWIELEGYFEQKWESKFDNNQYLHIKLK